MELRFREIRPDEVEQELTQKDQFNTDTVPLAATLIREFDPEFDRRQDRRRRRARDHPDFIQVRPTRPSPNSGARSLGPLEPHLRASEIDVARYRPGTAATS